MGPALEYLRAQGWAPRLVFVGPAARTWYVDLDVLATVMEMLSQAKPYITIHTTPVGFDFWVRRYADALSMTAEEQEPIEKDEVGRPVRDVMMLDGAAMLVAFPEESRLDLESSRAKKFEVELSDWHTADPVICGAAEKLKIPRLVVRRNGTTEWQR